MYLIRRPDYQSDTTQFIQQLREQKPGLEKRQFDGRELLWDKKVDRTLWQDLRAGRVHQKAYVYYSFDQNGNDSIPT
ncbi:MAG: acetyl-CoA carboxyl transferase [Burkholderiales bacterium 66-5]|uniref:DUF3460 family protein n=1 Tax=Comamonas sp. SCN 65-56 TaxID=1660095 RepID=UPI00086A6F6D|nr:DUF3460 family protein [Comamonas sp. SCN 65-56]ODS93306.1 MAG: acetyl-CoA carboxyl transferase [Comamonas sp. SCN 65-56]OJU89805.1 MAG: acetyl-CoA carboxyl transferase [Burkholderiales bacterium 66-5]